MNKTLKLMVSFLIVISLAALSFASDASERIDLAKFASQPEALAGRMIEVDAQVIAIDAEIVRPLPFNAAATVPESDGLQTEVVPLAVFN